MIMLARALLLGLVLLGCSSDPLADRVQQCNYACDRLRSEDQPKCLERCFITILNVSAPVEEPTACECVLPPSNYLCTLPGPVQDLGNPCNGHGSLRHDPDGTDLGQLSCYWCDDGTLTSSVDYVKMCEGWRAEDAAKAKK